MEALFLNNKQVDLAPNSISFDIVSNLLGDVDKIRDNRSYTIKLPATPTNNAIFEFCKNINFETDVYKTPFAARYERDGLTFFDNGKCFVLGCDSKGYEIALTWNNDVVTKIKSMKSIREELRNSNYDVILSQQGNDAQEFINAVGYGFKNYNYLREPGVTYLRNKLLPCVKVYRVLEWMLQKYKIKYDFSNWDSLIGNIVIPLGTRIRRDTDVDKATFSLINGVNFKNTMQSMDFFSRDSGHPSGDSSLTIYDDLDSVDYDMTIRITTQLPIAKITWTLRKNGDYIDRKEGTVTITAPLTLRMKGTIRGLKNQDMFTLELVGDLQYSTINGSGSFTATALPTEYMTTGRYYIGANLPDITLIDLIKQINLMFCTYNEVDEKGTLLLRGVKDFTKRRAGAVDLSRYLIQGTNAVTFKNQCGLARKNLFTWKTIDKGGADDRYNGFFELDDLQLKDEKKTESKFCIYRSAGEGSIEQHNEDVDLKYTLGLPIYPIRNPEDLKLTMAVVDGKNLTTAPLKFDSLIAKYYQEYIDFNDSTKSINVKLKMPIFAFKTIDMTKPVYFDQFGCNFAIGEISANGSDIYDVKLIKI